MQQDRHRALALRVLIEELPCAALAQDHRVDRLQVAWVRQQRDVHLLAVDGRPVVGSAQVVLDIAGACREMQALNCGLCENVTATVSAAA